MNGTMDASILDSVKKLLGIDPSYTAFDLDIITYINSVFVTLGQLGVKPDSFSISDATARWSDYVVDAKEQQIVLPYVANKVRAMFDPPTSSSVSEALNKVTEELEWRLRIYVDPE